MKCGARRGAILWNSAWVWGKPCNNSKGGFDSLGWLTRTKIRAPRDVVMNCEENPGKRSEDIAREYFVMEMIEI